MSPPATPPAVTLPPGYTLRTYRRGDETGFRRVLLAAGFDRWTTEPIEPWVARIPPDCWFMVVDEATDAIVATAMGLHDHSDLHPFGGELGWVACDPEHAGHGLGRAAVAAVTARLLAAGYHDIHLYTEHWRLAGLKTYLRLGYLPFLYTPKMPARWQTVCAELGWPYTPEAWPTPDTPAR